MNLQYLRTFLAVVRFGSISRAAESIGLTQPAASAQVKSLEASFGRPLFERHARGVAPTAFGEELARALGPPLDEAAAIVERARSRSWTLEGTVHFGGPAEFVGHLVAPVIARLGEDGLSVRVHLGGRERLYELFADEAIDLGITASEPHDPALGHAPLQREVLVPVAAPAHVATLGDAPLDADAFAALPLLAYDESLPLIRGWYERVHGRAIEARASVVAPSLTLLRDIAAAGHGVAVLPRYLVADALAGGELAEVPSPSVEAGNTLYLVWRRYALTQPRVAHAREVCLALLGDR